MKWMRTIGFLSVVWSGLLWAQPASYDDLLARARSSLAVRDYQGAVTATQQAIRTDDRRWEAYALAANAYSGQQLYDDAIGMLQLALPRAPEDRKQLVRDALQQVRKQMAAPVQPSAAQQPGKTARPTPPVQPGATQQEIVLWKSIENSSQAGDFESYLRAYPTGTYTQLAKDRIKSIRERQGSLPGSIWVGGSPASPSVIYFWEQGTCFEGTFLGSAEELTATNVRINCKWQKTENTVSIINSGNSRRRNWALTIKDEQINGVLTMCPSKSSDKTPCTTRSDTFHRVK